MKQLRLMLERLKNPSVVLSIASQIGTVLILLNVDVNQTTLASVVAAVCSVLVLLGIMSNPTTQNKGYADDIYECACCHKQTLHVPVSGQMVCSECGCIHDKEKPPQ